VHRTNLADIDRVKFDAGEGAAVVKIGNIGEFASKTIEGLDDDNVENAAIKFV
jgi:hypothetical protein